jgi:hypothetical protein
MCDPASAGLPGQPLTAPVLLGVYRALFNELFASS